MHICPVIQSLLYLDNSERPAEREREKKKDGEREQHAKAIGKRVI